MQIIICTYDYLRIEKEERELTDGYVSEVERINETMNTERAENYGGQKIKDHHV